MPRRLRKDFNGAWHHVWNRGIAKRTLFETRRDVRYFLSCLAWQVRAGDLEVHAFAVLTTHFHVLARSPKGRLSVAMQRAQDAYARWFNRSRRRDGPLFRGRFGNRIVDSEAYWWSLLGYIDRNPVEAGLCRQPEFYPYGSARCFCRPSGPAWLSRDVVERAMGRGADEQWDPRRYVAFSADSMSAGQRWVAERRSLSQPPGVPDPLDELLDAAPEKVLRWMATKSKLADGTHPGLVLVSPGTVSALLVSRRASESSRCVEAGGRRGPRWDVLEAGALKNVCGLTYREIRKRMETSLSTVQDRVRLHNEAMEAVPDYLQDASALLAAAIREDHRGAAHRLGQTACAGRFTGSIFRVQVGGASRAG